LYRSQRKRRFKSGPFGERQSDSSIAKERKVIILDSSANEEASSATSSQKQTPRCLVERRSRPSSQRKDGGRSGEESESEPPREVSLPNGLLQGGRSSSTKAENLDPSNTRQGRQSRIQGGQARARTMVSMVTSLRFAYSTMIRFSSVQFVLRCICSQKIRGTDGRTANPTDEGDASESARGKGAEGDERGECWS
jgi:hypothetical protein